MGGFSGLGAGKKKVLLFCNIWGDNKAASFILDIFSHYGGGGGAGGGGVQGFSAKLTVWLHRNWKLNRQCLDFL